MRSSSVSSDTCCWAAGICLLTSVQRPQRMSPCRGILRINGFLTLDQDAQRNVVWAAAAWQVDREVQVHVRIQSEAENVLRGVACALELLDAPVDDPVVLGGGLEFEDRHRASCDDRRRLPLSTRKGDLPHIRRCFDTNGVRYKRGQTPDMAATDDRS